MFLLRYVFLQYSDVVFWLMTFQNWIAEVAVE